MNTREWIVRDCGHARPRQGAEKVGDRVACWQTHGHIPPGPRFAGTARPIVAIEARDEPARAVPLGA